MRLMTDILLLVGAAVAVLAGVGLLKFSTPYARFHAAGKASPVAFLIAATGAALSLGWGGAGLLLIAASAMVLTLPLGVHLLFRAAHRSDLDGEYRPGVDELFDDEADEARLPAT